MITAFARTIFNATRELPAPDPTCRKYEYNEAWVMFRNREAYTAQSKALHGGVHEPANNVERGSDEA